MRLEEFISDAAGRLGFAAAGCAVVRSCRTFDRFQDWLARGFAGEMGYLAKNAEARRDPRRVAAAAKSVIVVAARYPAGHGGHFSNYARGRDYHDVLGDKLEILGQRIGTEIGRPLNMRICVDSAPVLEREWAVRAGLGWIGKQGCLVNPDLGCCLCLGELFVDLDLAPAEPATDRCGDCRLCVDACPAGAIQPDGLVDARKCVACLTIEHKGEIPENLRPALGSSLFGCDRCTAVCPWNRMGAERVMPELQPEAQGRPTPEECLALTADDFQRRFHGTAVYRTGLERLQRNAAVVLGNERKKSAVPALEMSLEKGTPLVKTHAAWALERCRGGNV